jgi:hypothetical protein
MAQKLVLYGDGLLVSQHGFGETLLDLLLIKAPSAILQAFIQGEDDLDIATATHEASWRVIGKAPQEILIALGASELLAGKQASVLLSPLEALVHLLINKTKATLILTALPVAFFDDGPMRQAAIAFNHGLKSFQSANVVIHDVNPEVEQFLESHRKSPGEKRALHLAANRPTSLGGHLLAKSLSALWPLNSALG